MSMPMMVHIYESVQQKRNRCFK